MGQIIRSPASVCLSSLMRSHLTKLFAAVIWGCLFFYIFMLWRDHTFSFLVRVKFVNPSYSSISSRYILPNLKFLRLLRTWPTAALLSQMLLHNVICVLPVVVNYSSLDTISPHGRRAFSVAGLAAWNCLCDEVCEPLLTVNSFRQLLKTRLFAEY